MWRSLFRWMFRRPVAPDAGAKAFGYAAVVTPLLFVFIAVSAIDVPLPRGGSESITELRFYADDPDALVARARPHLPAVPKATDSGVTKRPR
jgi:hypothetical protein